MKKTKVFASLRISLRMKKCVFKEVSESQKEGVEVEKQRQEMGACRSKAVSHLLCETTLMDQ